MFTHLALQTCYAGEVPKIGVSVSVPIDMSVTQTEIKSDSSPSFWCQLSQVIGSCLVLSSLDYYAYNSFKDNPEKLQNYRYAQVGLQLGTSSMLFFLNGGFDQWKEGLKVVGAFNLMHWTFVNDFIYYGIAEFVPADNPNGFQGKGAWAQASDPDGWATRHAWWTPLGLTRILFGTPKADLKFTPTELYVQAGLGTSISVTALALDFWKTPEAEKKNIAAQSKDPSGEMKLKRFSDYSANIETLSETMVKTAMTNIKLMQKLKDDPETGLKVYISPFQKMVDI